MNSTLHNVEDVAARHMCMGCGACAGAYPAHVEMVETLTHGRRPRCKTQQAKSGPLAQAMLRLCPGTEIRYPPRDACGGVVDELFDDWGPVLEVWEGHAADAELRYRGSSGGLVSALALYALERGGMAGVLHVKAREDVPFLNESVISTSRAQLLEGSGSRYAPSSPCERLHEVETSEHPCVFVGKPCDVAAARKAARARPALAAKLGLTIGIFCAGVPSLSATFDLMRRLGAADPSKVRELRYRGCGWPGRMTVVEDGGPKAPRSASVSYDEGWGEILQKKRQWRCHVCADHTGELGDLSVGDPWYRAVEPGDPGQSLLVVRTERGRRLVRQALAAGYVVLHERAPAVLPASQPNLLRTRGAMWGRAVASRVLRASAPRYPGLPLLRLWLTRLSWRERAQSLYGTARRVFGKRLRAREQWLPASGAALAPPPSAPVSRGRVDAFTG